MGLLFTTPGTQRIIDTLNTAFDRKGLALIQGAVRSSPNSKLGAMVRQRDWMPGQLARMLNLYPYDQSDKREKIKKRDIQRWFYFLRKVLGGTAAFAPIRNALADAILNHDSSGAKLNIVRVSFNCVELPAKTNPNVVIFDAPLPGDGGATVRHITLFTVYVGQDDSPPVDLPDDQDLPNPPWKTSDPSNPSSP